MRTMTGMLRLRCSHFVFAAMLPWLAANGFDNAPIGVFDSGLGGLTVLVNPDGKPLLDPRYVK